MADYDPKKMLDNLFGELQSTPVNYHAQRDRSPSPNEQGKMMRYMGLNQACMELFKIIMGRGMTHVLLPLESEPAWILFCDRAKLPYMPMEKRRMYLEESERYGLTIQDDFSTRTSTRLFGVHIEFWDRFSRDEIAIVKSDEIARGIVEVDNRTRVGTFSDMVNLLTTCTNTPLVVAACVFYFLDQQELLVHKRVQGQSFPRFLRVNASYDLNAWIHKKFESLIDSMRRLNQEMPMSEITFKALMMGVKESK
jgi:hypothetical protein